MKRKASVYEIRRKNLMMENGFDQEFWANRWGTTQSFVSQLISGKSRGLARELDFANFFGKPHSYLFPPHRHEVTSPTGVADE
jgi:hypothetical protein